MRYLLAVASLLGACGGGHAATVDAPGSGSGSGMPDASDGRTEVAALPVTLGNALDVLFVVDDSPSMTDKQQNLADNFPNFINVLNTLPNGLPDLHLAVATTDMGTSASATAPGDPVGTPGGSGSCSGTGKNGAFQPGTAVASGSYLIDLGHGATKNYTGDVSSAFASMARVGATGCGFEQHLAGMTAALDDRNPGNAGFVRPGVQLMVVFVTDEDDCTLHDAALIGPDTATFGPLQSFRCTRFGVTCATGGTTTDEMNQVGHKDGCTENTTANLLDTVEPYHDFLTTLKDGDASKVLVGVIGGVATPVDVELRAPPNGTPIPALAHSCQYTGASGNEVADPAVRLAQFASAFPDHSAFSTVCEQDQSEGLQNLAQLANYELGNPCIATPLPDSDPNMAGAQFDCIAEDVVGTTTTRVPKCDANNTPTCFEIVTDQARCFGADHLELVVHRDPANPPDPATITHLRCRL